MQSVALKDRRSAVVQFVSLALAYETGRIDDSDAELFASMVGELMQRRKGVVSSGVSDLAKRKEAMEGPLQNSTAVNLVLHALDSVASVARMDNRQLAEAFRETREKLLRMSTDSAVAAPPAGLPTAPPGSDLPD